MRTRYWHREDGTSCTAVQFRTDEKPMVWIHTNIGWLGCGNTPTDEAEAEAFAEDIANGYNLTEADQRTALYMAGGEGFEPGETLED